MLPIDYPNLYHLREIPILKGAVTTPYVGLTKKSYNFSKLESIMQVTIKNLYLIFFQFENFYGFVFKLLNIVSFEQKIYMNMLYMKKCQSMNMAIKKIKWI